MCYISITNTENKLQNFFDSNNECGGECRIYDQLGVVITIGILHSFLHVKFCFYETISLKDSQLQVFINNLAQSLIMSIANTKQESPLEFEIETA